MTGTSSPLAARIGLGIGALMVGIAVYIAIRVMVTGAPPLTGKTWLDLAFAFFFAVRGWLQYTRWRRASAPPAP